MQKFLRGYLAQRHIIKAKSEYLINKRLSEVQASLSSKRFKIIEDLQIKVAYLYRRKVKLRVKYQTLEQER